MLLLPHSHLALLLWDIPAPVALGIRGSALQSLPLYEDAGFPLESSWCCHGFALPALQGRGGQGEDREKGKWGCDNVSNHPSRSAGIHLPAPESGRRSGGPSSVVEGLPPAEPGPAVPVREQHRDPIPALGALSLLTLERHQRR